MFERLLSIYITEESIKKNNSKKSYHIAFLIKGKSSVLISADNLYQRQCFEGRIVTSMHAEINCVRQLGIGTKKRPSCPKNLKLLVVNIHKGTGKLKNSLPCKDCCNYLLSKGFKHIYCSIQDGTIHKFKLTEIDTTYTKSQIKFKENGFE